MCYNAFINVHFISIKKFRQCFCNAEVRIRALNAYFCDVGIDDKPGKNASYASSSMLNERKAVNKVVLTIIGSEGLISIKIPETNQIFLTNFFFSLYNLVFLLSLVLLLLSRWEQ